MHIREATNSAIPESSVGGLFRQAYAGQAPLWKTFWLFFVPSLLVVYGLYIGAVWGWIRFMSLDHVVWFVLAASTFIFLVMSIPCSAVWRCAVNSQNRYWGYLARFVVAAYLLWYGLRVLSLWSVLGR